MPEPARVNRALFVQMWTVEHLPVLEICQRLGVSPPTVGSFVKGFGLPPRIEARPSRWAIHPTRSAEFKQLWHAMIREPDIAAHFGVSVRTVRGHAVRLGLGPRGKGNDSKFGTLADFNALRLRDAMARDAEKCRVQFEAAEMVDGRRTGGDGRRAAA